MSLALPFFNPYFFIGYLIAIAFFGLFQAIFMANARRRLGQRQENRGSGYAPKGDTIACGDRRCDTVGDPFKDTSSVSLNPVIKFTTLFGLLAVEIACHDAQQTM